MTNDGLQYIVMEFVKGPGLHQLLYNRDPCIEGHRLQLVRQMAEALEYVHEQKYIHRDVCPRNFIYETETGNIKLIDFGLSAAGPSRIHGARQSDRHAALHGPRGGPAAVDRPAVGHFRHGRLRLPDLHL